RFGDEISLHQGLVGCVFLQVPEKAVESHDPDAGVASEIEIKAAEAEFALFPREAERGRRAAWNQIKQKSQANENADAFDESLNDIRPDDGFQSANDSVKDRNDAGGEHDKINVPASHSGDGEGQRVEDEAHF